MSISCQKRFVAAWRKGDGFSLIELLVVILVIAVLAAIAVPIFLKQRERAWVAQLQSSLKNAAAASESYAAGTGDGGYTDPSTGNSYTLVDIQAEGFKTTSPEIIITSIVGTTTEFCVEAYHGSLGAAKTMAISGDHTTPDEGTCTGTMGCDHLVIRAR